MASKKIDVSSSSSVPADADAQSRAGWWRVSGWKLRSKIALALTFPMVAASWFAVDKSAEAWIVQGEYQATAGQIRVLGPTIDYLYAAENATVVSRAAKGANSPASTKAVEEVREAAEKLEALVDDTSLTENQRAQLTGLIALSDQLRDGRAYVTLLQSLSQVRQLHNGVNDFYLSILNGQNSPEPVLQQISFVMEGRLAFTLQQLQVAYSGNRITNAPEVFSALGVEDAAISQLARARNDAVEVLSLRSLSAARFDTVEAGQGELAYAETLALYDELTDVILDESAAALDENAASARSKAIANIVILALSLLTTLVLAAFIARLMTRPVKKVRDGARDVASNQLPRAVAAIRAGEDPGAVRPVDVHTDEEMGQLARAVDELHQTAVDLAKGEAELRTQVGEMFVTLSRRNTSLINQQLGLIEELERDEQDPRRLESLFRLDHLAARMRRTAESLVILSDAPVRQRDSHSLSVGDSIQAATAGVQEYQRVEVRGASSDSIVGAAANDVVHLLTELIDNALSFSPPTEPVHVSTTSAVGQTVISISDGGLGLPDDVLKQLNGMLASDVGITPDAARRMGLFVVSRLAKRHSIDVTLTKNGRGGITATVTLPAALLVGGASTPLIPAPAAPVEPTLARAAVETPVAPVVEPVIQPVITPEVPAQASAPAEASPAVPQVRETPRPDPLTDPLPVAAHEEPTPVAPPAPAAPPRDPQVEQVNAAIDAVTGLPKRRPGATVPGRQSAVQPQGGSLFGPPAEVAPTLAAPEPAEEHLAPVSLFARPVKDAAEPAPQDEEAKPEGGALGIFSLREARANRGEGADQAADGTDAAPESAELVVDVTAQEDGQANSQRPEPTISAHDPLGLDTPRVTEPAPAEPQLAEPEVTDPAPVSQEPPAPVVIEAPAPTQVPAASLPTRTPGAHGIVPPATEAPASGWLGNGANGSTTWGAADDGWKAAHRATEAEAAPSTSAGLPQRQPGRRLVPGSVAPARTAPTRDPEAIRKRLAAHAAGVSRGRTATATTAANTEKEGPA